MHSICSDYSHGFITKSYTNQKSCFYLFPAVPVLVHMCSLARHLWTLYTCICKCHMKTCISSGTFLYHYYFLFFIFLLLLRLLWCSQIIEAEIASNPSGVPAQKKKKSGSLFMFSVARLSSGSESSSAWGRLRHMSGFFLFCFVFSPSLQQSRRWPVMWVRCLPATSDFNWRKPLQASVLWKLEEVFFFFFPIYFSFLLFWFVFSNGIS